MYDRKGLQALKGSELENGKPVLAVTPVPESLFPLILAIYLDFHATQRYPASTAVAPLFIVAAGAYTCLEI